jgi:hypothetical protein
MKVFPGRIFLERVELCGVESGGKLTVTSEISATGKGCIADILPLGGVSVEILLDPDRIGSRVTDYTDIGSN